MVMTGDRHIHEWETAASGGLRKRRYPCTPLHARSSDVLEPDGYHHTMNVDDATNPVQHTRSCDVLEPDGYHHTMNVDDATNPVQGAWIPVHGILGCSDQNVLVDEAIPCSLLETTCRNEERSGIPQHCGVACIKPIWVATLERFGCHHQ
jgi:hypothetical protein